ncbi:MAG TPA: VOC family protein [Flavitalea sp.]|nr:VOC family protein [Flavitalea sp.]
MKKIVLACIVVFVMNTMPTLLMGQSKPLLNHIAYYVKDLKVSSDFYSRVIGLDTIPEPFHDGKHTWYRVSENSHLHLIQGAKEVTSHDKNTHLCFSVPSVEEVIARLNKNNVEYESWAGDKMSVTTRVDGIKQLYFVDPDGYWIEINNDYPKNVK